MTMHTYTHTIIHDRRGFTLLLVIVLSAAFFSIAMGIVNILLGQIIIIGQAGESFRALYAADIAMERTLYRDRTANICGGINCTETKQLPNGACYTATVQIGPSVSCPGPLNRRCIDVTGQDICGTSERYVQRRFDIKYR